MFPSATAAVLCTLLLTVTATDSSIPISDRHSARTAPLCNSYTPTCGLTAAQARARYLTPYAAILPKLRNLKRRSTVPLEIGPLVRNATSKWGLVDIDVPLPSLSSVNPTPCVNLSTRPTIRQAVVCTVSSDKLVQPPRGNLHASRIGRSNPHRILWGARLGNPDGFRIFISTQLHGNEPTATEAAFELLHALTRWPTWARPILACAQFTFALRVNPDAGEPTATADPPVGKPFLGSTAFFRHNIDPTAGGGFQSPSETDFFGVVGRGYDLNRYMRTGLYNAVRPIESQAIVAVLLATRPDIVFDLHGDAPKVVCELDATSVRPKLVAGVLPAVKCKPPAPPVPSLASARELMVEGGFFGDDASVLVGPGTDALKRGPTFTAKTRLVRSWVAAMFAGAQPQLVGELTRFSTVRSGVSFVNNLDGTMDRANMVLGGVGSGWEVLTFTEGLRPAVTGLSITADGPKPDVTVDTADVEPCFLRDSICINSLLLRRLVLAVPKLVGKRLRGDGGFCTIGLDDASVVSLPAERGFGELSLNETVMVPQGGNFGVPTEISGKCTGDAGSP